MLEKPVQLSVPTNKNPQNEVRGRKRKKVQLRDNYVLEDFYMAVRNNRLDSIHVPHSDVFFVKYALEAKASQSSDSVLRAMEFRLKDVEAAMRAEGWNESRVLKPNQHKAK